MLFRDARREQPATSLHIFGFRHFDQSRMHTEDARKTSSAAADLRMTFLHAAQPSFCSSSYINPVASTVTWAALSLVDLELQDTKLLVGEATGI
jgi:hypothetical protein